MVQCQQLHRYIFIRRLRVTNANPEHTKRMDGCISPPLFKTLFDSSHRLIAYIDRICRFVQVNHAYAAAHKRSPDYFQGRGFFELFPDSAMQNNFMAAIETKKSMEIFDVPFIGLDRKTSDNSRWDWLIEPVHQQAFICLDKRFSRFNAGDSSRMASGTSILSPTAFNGSRKTGNVVVR
jgi:PAS domain-containing protein